MSLQYSIQKGVSDFTFIIGTGLKYGGGFALLTMAIVGTVAIDIVILAAAEKNHDAFLTGFILGSLFSRDFSDPTILLAISPITTAIAVGLSFGLGVPWVGIGLLIGWGVAAGLLVLGFALEALAEAIRPVPVLVEEEDLPSTFSFSC